MDSLFKLIFYLIIITFWVLNNTKKQKKWEQDSPDLPEDPYRTLKRPVQEPAPPLEPAKEIIGEKVQTVIVPDISMLSPEQILEIRRERAKTRKDRQIRKKPAPEAASALEVKSAHKKPEPAPPRLKETKKPTLYLKSSVKEGIIWSIVLGPPRSRVRFNWKNSPIQR